MDPIGNWVSLREIVFCKCNQRYFNSVNIRSIYKTLALMANGALEDQYQDVYGALEKKTVFKTNFDLRKCPNQKTHKNESAGF